MGVVRSIRIFNERNTAKMDPSAAQRGGPWEKISIAI